MIQLMTIDFIHNSQILGILLKMFRIVAFVGNFIKIHSPPVREFQEERHLSVSVSFEWSTASCLLSLIKQRKKNSMERRVLLIQKLDVFPPVFLLCIVKQMNKETDKNTADSYTCPHDLRIFFKMLTAGKNTVSSGV